MIADIMQLLIEYELIWKRWYSSELFNASLFRIEFRFCGMNEMDSVLNH